MRVEQDSYEEPAVNRIVADVLKGGRTRQDLQSCGCPLCKEALTILGGKGKDGIQ
jgi:hypothetical protein